MDVDFIITYIEQVSFLAAPLSEIQLELLEEIILKRVWCGLRYNTVPNNFRWMKKT